ncbi:MAG TPA: hypothetical protein VMS08_02105, partial [Candidatus Saccharimonadia bacterium]|nr:hypothetical protein [Candidatus Saccharimonadia bacterium]
MLTVLAPIWAGLILVGAIGFGPTTALATTGITTSDTTINFQGRLLTAAGAVVPDGTYNMQFKIYKNGDGTATGDTGGVGGTLLWTEQWIQDTAG